MLRRCVRSACALVLVTFAGSGVLAQETVFRYSFWDDTPLPTVPDEEGPGNNATAGANAVISDDIPVDGLPGDEGNSSLDSSAQNASGVVTDSLLLLSNDLVAAAGGFTMECWLKWNGTGTINSVIDYAGTEKIVVDQNTQDAEGNRLVEMRWNSAAAQDTLIGQIAPGSWHYVAVVFDTQGNQVAGDGSLTGTVRTYFDGLIPTTVAANITKSNFGDSLNRPIGVGQHPLGFASDYFDGLVFEPRVSLGALDPADLLLDAPLPKDPEDVLLYSFSSTTPLPNVPDSSGKGNNGTAGAGAALDTEVPGTAPGDAGNRSLDTSAAGVVSNATGILNNDEVESFSGFTMECWFWWGGGGDVASIVDYAGAEKIVLDASGDIPGQVSMVFGDTETFPIGIASPGRWHYVAAVFSTGGKAQEPDGSLSGTLNLYFDRLAPVAAGAATKTTLGDDRNQGIGVGQSPSGAAGSRLDGLVFEPRVAIGPVEPSGLRWIREPAEEGTVFRYSFFEDLPLPLIPDVGPAGNPALAETGALFSLDIPEVGVPEDAGEVSLDSATNAGIEPSGASTTTPSLLTNQAIAEAGGFTMECWLKWNGAGTVNSIIDYAGTEKIVVQGDAGDGNRYVYMRMAGMTDTLIGVTAPGEWHYVAVVFDTEGALQNPDGTISGTLRTYFDTLLEVSSIPATKDNFGDSLNRPIGVGQHPIAATYAGDTFDGLVYEPRVSLGALATEDLLLDAVVVEPPAPVFRYSFAPDTALPNVPDSSGAGNDGTAGANAVISRGVPGARPAGDGGASLDTSGSAGVVSNDRALLDNDLVTLHAGFTMETWFLWRGGNAQASVLDYSGTERIVVDGSAGSPAPLLFLMDGEAPIAITDVSPNQWHYVAVVFDTGGTLPNANGSVTGSVEIYLDSFAPVLTVDRVTKTNAGDDANLGIGVGQGPSGGAVLDGLVYEPRVTLGPLGANALLYVLELDPSETAFRYSFEDDGLLPLVTDAGPAGNDGTAGAGAQYSTDIPDDGVPDDAGEVSLDARGGGALLATGVVTNATLLLANTELVRTGGFTMECWFKWYGGVSVNSIMDYAGTEKIVIDNRAGPAGLTLRMAGLAADLPIGDPILEQWHYVAVVFSTGGKGANPDGTVTGTVTVYLDGTDPVGVYPGVTKNNFGDSLVRSIGVGQHPNGFANDFFDGLVFEPRVSLGALSSDELLYGGGGGPGLVTFKRADANADGDRNITDGIFVLNYLFLGGQTPPCLDAADANDDGDINITDGIFILNFLFLGGPEPPPPFEFCGTDPGGDDGIDCLTFLPCGPP